MTDDRWAAWRPRLPWVVLWAATALAVAVVVGGRAAFARGYRTHADAERATFARPSYRDDPRYWVQLFPWHATVARVRSGMAGFGPFVPAAKTSPEDERYTCEAAAVGRPNGWRVTFEFDRGRLVDSHYVATENPILHQWDGWAATLRWGGWTTHWVLVTGVLAVLLTAPFAWGYRRQLGSVAMACAALGVTLAMLGDRPSATFRPRAQWPAAAVSAALLATAAALAIPPGKPVVRRGTCGRCGYSLQGNVSGVCPECGTPAPRRPPRSTAAASAAAALATMTGDGSTSDNAGGQ